MVFKKKRDKNELGVVERTSVVFTSSKQEDVRIEVNWVHSKTVSLKTKGGGKGKVDIFLLVILFKRLHLQHP